MKLFGTHGTVKESARNIISSNFFPKPGRGGTGVYFWRKNEYSMILAKGWYEFYLKKKKYDNITDNSFAYINVEIVVEEDNFLDFEMIELKDRVSAITYEKKLNRGTSEKEISALYDYIITRLEEELGVKFYVWQLRVNAPYSTNEYPLTILGNPLCYVVNNNDLVTILDGFVEEDGNERQII